MRRTIVGLTLLLAVAPLAADVLLIEPVRQAERMELPKNGLSQAQVRAQWGEPVERHGAVGQPPISRWDYTDFSVYFEYDTVLSTVLKPGEVISSSTG